MKNTESVYPVTMNLTEFKDLLLSKHKFRTAGSRIIVNGIQLDLSFDNYGIRQDWRSIFFGNDSNCTMNICPVSYVEVVDLGTHLTAIIYTEQSDSVEVIFNN